jgi:hypothetical protein
MTDTTFVAYSNATPIAASWLNDVNALTYNKIGTQVNPLNIDRIEPITAFVSGNNLTIGLNPTALDFRSSTLTTGVPNTRQVGVALSMLVPSGGTLGTANAVSTVLLVLAIDNVGTVELAIINPTSIIDESGLISTMAVDASSTSAGVAYSTTARTSIPYRVVGMVFSNQAAAGTWATQPTLVQGSGGKSGIIPVTDFRYAASMPNFNATTTSNLITATLSGGKYDFRNTSLTTGTPIEFGLLSTLTLAVPAIAASLGATTAVATTLVYAIVYAAGVPQLAVSNTAGGLQLDETNLITTTAIGSGSTAANVWYSTSAIATASQYRVVGSVNAIWTSGTGWSSPTLVQPLGASGLTLGNQRIRQGVSVATTSGTAIDFTGIPSWAKRITLSLSGVSTSGTAVVGLQIGSGSVDTTGYLGDLLSIVGTGATNLNFTTMFSFFYSTASSDIRHGSIVLTSIGSNLWVIHGNVGLSNSVSMGTLAGSKSLSGALDRVRITTANGTDLFDAGTANIMWEG